MTVIRILFAAVFVWFVCLSSGDLLFRALRLQFPRRERIFLAFLSGAALVSTVMFLLAAFTLVYTGVLLIAGFAVVSSWIYFCRPDFRNPRGLGPNLPWLWQIAFWAPLLVYGCLYLLTALAPETDPDGTTYHVGLITRYYGHHGFFPIYTNMYAGLAEGIEMLFWIAFSLGRHSAASMVEMLFLAMMPFGMLSFGERIGMPRAGAAGALLFYLAPVVGKDGTIAYIDVATAAVVFGAFYILEIWSGETNGRDGDRLLVSAGLLAGFSFACKITASTAVVYTVAVVLIVAVKRKGWGRGLRAALVVTGSACVISLPWVLKNIIQFHNPFFPVFNRWFPNPYQYPMVEDGLRHDMAHLNGVAYSQIPFELAIGGHLVGTIGPIFFLAPLALLSLRFRNGRHLLIACIAMSLPYFSNTGARFFIPALPFLAMALAIALVRIPKVGPTLALVAVVFHSWSAWPGVIERWVPGFQWRIDPIDVRADFRIIPESRFLNMHMSEYAPGLLLDQFVPTGERVFSPSVSQRAYHHRDILGTFDSAAGRRAWDILLSTTPGPMSNQWHRNISFSAVTTSRMRLKAVTKIDNEVRIGEIRFFNGQAELVRSSEWQMRASRNPWEIRLAFDNDPISWWTSGQAVDVNTWIEVDFPHPVSIDRVTVDQIEDQQWIQLSPLAHLDGTWTPLKAVDAGHLTPPAPNLRMHLKDELKSMGIHWILIVDGSLGADDLRTNSPLWGIKQIAETNGYRLWKLE